MQEEDFEFKSVEPGTWTPEKEGDSLFGVYLSEEPKKDNVGARYFIENKNGIHMVWGSAILDERMKLIQKGTPIKIVFKGQTKSKNGRDLNLFDVQVGKKKGATAPTPAEPAPAAPTTMTEEAVN